MAVPIVSIFDGGQYEQHDSAVAQDLLNEGGIVVLPTETVYGAAGLSQSARSAKTAAGAPRRVGSRTVDDPRGRSDRRFRISG